MGNRPYSFLHKCIHYTEPQRNSILPYFDTLFPLFETLKCQSTFSKLNSKWDLAQRDTVT